MKKLLLSFIIFINLSSPVKAELEFESNYKFPISSETIKISKNGILLGEYSNILSSSPFNGLYFDNSGNLEFKPKTLSGYKITDLDEDENYYYASAYMVINGKQGLFKISKDFKQFENIGVKAATRRILQYKNKVYTGGYTHGLYTVNKDGTNLIQIIGDGYFGPQIDDIKANSKNVYALSRGLLYKIDYYTNLKEQILISQRPSFIEVDEDRIYLSAYNKFYYLSFDNKISNEKTFVNKITFLKKYKNLIVLVETDSTNNYFWISNDNGSNFYKSKTVIPATSIIKDIEVTGDKIYTLYFSIANEGISKARLVFDFDNTKIFNTPFQISREEDLIDRITAFFDHRYPYLGNKLEEDEHKNTTLNFLGENLPKPLMYYSSHDGVDFGLPLNTPILSVSDGVASYFYDEFGLGHAIKVSHPNNYITIYGHLSEEGLITKNSPIPVSKGQIIGRVGLSGNTSGPHLHFTTYLGDKLLNNKVDPFGWKSIDKDPWELIGSKSNYLWSTNEAIYSNQFDPNNNNKFNTGQVGFEIINFPFYSFPLSIETTHTPPIYDQANYLYKPTTSYLINGLDFEGNTIPQSILGIIKYSGFKTGDDKFYSIWKYKRNLIERQVTSYDNASNSLSTIFEPNASYLVLKNNYRKVRVISNIKVN